MTDYSEPIERGKSIDEHIDETREYLGSAINQAKTMLAPHRSDDRFSLKLSMHPFHRSLQERDGTWTKDSLLEILDTLNEAIETRIWLSADGVFLPYPIGPKETYRPDRAHYAFDRVIRIVAPIVIQIARTIANAEHRKFIPHTSAVRGSWHEAIGLLRRINGEVAEEIRMIKRYERSKREEQRPLLTTGRHTNYGGFR